MRNEKDKGAASEIIENNAANTVAEEFKDFDLASLDTVAASDEGAELQLKHFITDKPLPVYIKLLGKHSTTFREIQNERVNDRIAKEAAAKSRNRQVDIPTAEEAEERAIELLSACTLGWRTGDENFIILKGEKLEFNIPNVRRVYREMIWVREQVDGFIGDLENFIKG